MDAQTRARIRALAIPPAWTDVWICAHPNGHLQAIGTDAAGRRQYRYHDRWRARRDVQKFDRMLAFARALPRLRERAGADLGRPGLPKEKALACAIRLLDLAPFRVGSEAYARLNGTYGLSTIRKDQVAVGRGRVVFDFVAKNGTRRIQEVHDPELLPIIATMRRRRGGGSELLAYRDGGRWRDLRSNDINDYLREASGGEFTAKDFRTWHATVFACATLAAHAAEATSVSSSRRAAVAGVKEVAAFLGNTPAVARSSYIDPRVLDRFDEGETIGPALDRAGVDDPADPRFREVVEAAVLELLESDAAATDRAA